MSSPPLICLNSNSIRMKISLLQSPDGVTLVGGGPVSARDLRLAMSRAPRLVAADSGADRLLAAGMMPEAVIGDLDSISQAALARIPAARLHRISEQATTDFDKALRHVAAPFVLAVGFTGARIDHGLAVLNSLVRQSNRPCILIGPKDLTFAAPAGALQLQLVPDDTLSLFPFARVTGRSKGLQWPIEGLNFAPDGFIGTSNRVSAAQVQLEFDAPGMVVILPRRRLDAVISALVPPTP